ncbi:MAG: SDR family oxidoreductase [Chloroflexota bacterium]|nr:SDR family oxidoreductase [Chloroflexota bacterium]
MEIQIMTFEKRAALITGGATGIGQATALRLAANGVSVVIADMNDDAGKATADRIDGLFVHCDASRHEDVKQAMQETHVAFGSIDILVTAAAHTGGHYAAAEMPVTEWQRGIDVSLSGAFYASKYAASIMKVQRYGSIIHIASVEGMIGAVNHAAYVTAKTAIFGLTRSLAIDYGRFGIRVNAVSPGIIDSGRPDIEAAKQDPERVRFWREMTVLNRIGRTEEVAAAVCFLASDDASYITGQNLAVDGGWTIGYPVPLSE